MLGTWQDSTSDMNQPPSNVTRLTRVLSREAKVVEDGVEKIVPQVIYYQKGVGTGLFLDQFLGGATASVLCVSVCKKETK